MNSELRQLAVKLRREKELSYTELKRQLGVPKSTLSYWLKDMPISNERIRDLKKIGYKNGEAGREKYRNTMRLKREAEDNRVYKFYFEKLENVSKDTLFVAGLMLYLGEGDKKNNTRIVLANTDFDIIQFFIKWLIQFMDVERSEIKVQLHLYEDMDIEKVTKIWQDRLGLSKKQYYKSSIRKLKESSFSYSDSVRHGTCSIYVLGVERKRKLSMAIKAFVDRYIKN
jgi:transposase-like protein